MTILLAAVDIKQQLDHLFENLLAIIVFLAGGTALFFVGKIREGIYQALQSRLRKTSRLRPATTAGHLEINRMLETLIDDMQAFRVCIFQFHNGDSFMLSNHSWKVSCTHEVLSPGATPAMQKYQSLPVSAISDWIAPIIDPDANVPGARSRAACCACKDTCPYAGTGHRVVRFDLADTRMSVASAMSRAQGINHSLTVNLVDPVHNSTFGFISLHYKDTAPETVDALEVGVCQVCEMAEKIQFYLTTDFRAIARTGKPWWGFLTKI